MLPISVSSTGLRETIEQQTLHMKVSKQYLSPMNKPFHVAYYGVGTARISRDELLGKIGAALVASAPPQDISKCYNIFPTEFGPGSTPAFAELIPSQAQMIVDDITVLRHGPDRPDTIRFALKQGTIFESNTAIPTTGVAKAPWRPSLLVVHLCRDDLADDFYTAKQVIELAERHFWPLIVVSQDTAAGLYPPCSRDLNKEFVTQTADTSDFVEHPIDLDTFLRIHTDQLNKHIRFVLDAAASKVQSLQSSSSIIDRVKVVTRQLFDRSSGGTSQANRYVLQMVQTSPKPATRSPMLQTYKAKVMQFFPEQNYKRSLQDLVASLAITAVVLAMIGVYQVIAPAVVSRISSALAAPLSIDAPTTVTATSAISTYVHSPTTVVQDNTISKGLDQMLQRLMGKAEVDEAPAQEGEETLGRPQPETDSEVKVGSPQRNASDEMSSSLDRLISKIQLKLDAAHKRWDETSTKDKTRQKGYRERRRQKVKEFQIRMHRFSDNISNRSRQLQQRSLDSLANLLAKPQRKLAELIDQSQMLVQVSRRRAAQNMDDLVKDQKSLLRKAQRQAQQIAARPKETVNQEAATEGVKQSKLQKAVRNFLPFI